MFKWKYIDGRKLGIWDKGQMKRDPIRYLKGPLNGSL